MAAIKSVSVSTWVAAEISEITDRHHVYITLIETDANGKIAELRVSIWASGKAKLLARFTDGTGGEKLRKGLKVLLKLKPSLSPIYGLSATVEDIDPTFTLGAAAIENRLHWMLDVCFGEDDCMIRKDNAPQNLSLLKKIVLNLIRADKTDTAKTSLRLKRKRAAWDDDIRMKMLGIHPL